MEADGTRNINPGKDLERGREGEEKYLSGKDMV
jgi:hypothetical protein